MRLTDETLSELDPGDELHYYGAYDVPRPVRFLGRMGAVPGIAFSDKFGKVYYDEPRWFERPETEQARAERLAAIANEREGGPGAVWFASMYEGKGRIRLQYADAICWGLDEFEALLGLGAQ